MSKEDVYGYEPGDARYDLEVIMVCLGKEERAAQGSKLHVGFMKI